MRLDDRRESDNVVDNRGRSPQGLMIGGGGLMTVVVIILALVFGVDPRPLLQNMPQGNVAVDQGDQDPQAPGERTEEEVLVSKVLAMTEDVWTDLLPAELGKQYQAPQLSLFRRVTDSACGQATSATGPFYCPGDGMVYIDLQFFRELDEQFKAGGDFAQAYVIAHEIGHHVQNLLGISRKAQETEMALKRRGKDAEANHISVRVELQADFLAGVWAHHAERQMPFLDRGDLEEALNAAEKIGDDRLQKQARGVVIPDSFTHGTSAQRKRWFKRGFDSGKLTDMQQLFDLDYDKL